ATAVSLGRPAWHRRIGDLRELLANARRPLLVLGGSGWDGAARKRLGAFVEANGLPVATSFRRQDLFDNRGPHYA
ncbi:thiamine pyrophosphate-binding protein, partial [Pseudomonas aeruginosa]